MDQGDRRNPEIPGDLLGPEVRNGASITEECQIWPHSAEYGLTGHRAAQGRRGECSSIDVVRLDPDVADPLAGPLLDQVMIGFRLNERHPIASRPESHGDGMIRLLRSADSRAIRVDHEMRTAPVVVANSAHTKFITSGPQFLGTGWSGDQLPPPR